MCTRLAEGLRELRARAGLSMAALAGRTAYSKSSWERYLNGKQLAPRQAVEALCKAAGEPPGRLVALWELADLEWSGRAHRPTPPVAQTDAAPSHGERPGDHGTPGLAYGWSIRRHRGILAATCAVGRTAAIGLTTLLHTATENPTKSAPSAPPAPGCLARACVGSKPTVMGCAMPSQEKVLRKQKLSTGAPLEVVYSKQCRAAWALVGSAQVGDVLTVSTPGGAHERARVADKYDAEGPLVTPMVDGSDLTGLQACFTSAGGQGKCLRL
ncbi:helix-turn-helix domain-containing protein [Streptomyces sp. NPDC056178]|uniref:helix-turn-helix domain-containing protein n=1 Tax=unclassified Streptomyces TaxID=2593676 RepID=UPI0035E318DC